MTNEEFIKSVSLEGEIWKDVVGYVGFYICSSLGRLISLSRLTYNGVSYYYSKPRLLKPCEKDNGYLVVSIYKEPQKRKTHYVHRLIAEAFCDNPKNKPHIDHINTNKKDNRVENLRWVTQQENNKNPLSSKKISLSKKGKNNAKLSHHIVSIDKYNKVTYYCSLSYTRNIGFSRYKITKCCNGLLDYYDNKRWMYLSDYKNLINKSKNS